MIINVHSGQQIQSLKIICCQSYMVKERRLMIHIADHNQFDIDVQKTDLLIYCCSMNLERTRENHENLNFLLIVFFSNLPQNRQNHLLIPILVKQIGDVMWHSMKGVTQQSMNWMKVMRDHVQISIETSDFFPSIESLVGTRNAIVIKKEK